MFDALSFHARRLYNRMALKTVGDSAFDRQIATTLAFEGGLNDSRATTGELSNYGVSLRSFPQLGEDGIINLTQDQAIEIYYSGTLPDGTSAPFGWLHLGFDTWPQGLKDSGIAGKCFDLTINPGMGNGLKVVIDALKTYNVIASISGWRDPNLVSALLSACTKTVAGAQSVLAQIRVSLGDYYEQKVRDGAVPARFLPGLMRRAAS